MPFFSPVWARRPTRRVAAPRARLDVGDDAAAAARAARPQRRVPRRAAALPPHADRHALGVVEGRDRRASCTSAPQRITVVPPGHRPVVLARAATRVADAARRRGRPARPGEALRRPDRRARRRCKPRQPGAARGDRRRGLRARRARGADRRARRRATGSRCPAASTTPTLLDLYRRAWVLASASAHEGWGMTITEAAACGTPAVATRIAGHADAVVDERTGLLVDDPRELGAALERVLADDAFRDACSASALAHATRFTWGATARGTLEVLAQRGPAPPPVVSSTLAAADRGRADDRRRVDAAVARALGYALLALRRVRAAAAQRPGQGRGRHQAVPLPRPGPAAVAGGVDVGPAHRHGHGHPPDHRLPVPDGSVLLAPRQARRARLGRAAPVARLDPVLRRRSACSTCCARSGCAGPGVVVAALAYMFTPYSLDYSARISVLLLPWAALPWMIAAHAQGAARRRLALSRDLRAHRAGHRRRERDRADLRRRRPGAVDPVRVADRPRGRLAARARRDACASAC